jgi:hypothetical protein
MPFTLVTKPNRPWLLKMSAFLIVLIGFGIYGFYDATVAYPNRGIRHASFAQFQYLEEAKKDALSDTKTSVDDPAGELSRLKAEGSDKLTGAKAARYAWLSALDVVGRLKPEYTQMPGPGEKLNPTDKLAALRKEWTGTSGAKNAPKPLSSYDIKVQWLFVIAGLGGGAFLLLHIVRILSRKYRWDPETKQLQLPDGSTLSPSDIAEFDKRKWDKFLIYLHIKPGHPKHGGKELLLDLYQHAPLESWVLEMERIAFPDHEPPTTPTAAPPAQ